MVNNNTQLIIICHLISGGLHFPLEMMSLGIYLGVGVVNNNTQLIIISHLISGGLHFPLKMLSLGIYLGIGVVNQIITFSV